MFDISDEKYEELRLILEKQNGRAYTFEEVKEIGDGLLGFFMTLLAITGQNETQAIDT